MLDQCSQQIQGKKTSLKKRHGLKCRVKVRWHLRSTENEEEVGGKDSKSKRREGSRSKDTHRMLDVCPAIVVMPNPLLDLRAARTSEATLGGFGML